MAPECIDDSDIARLVAAGVIVAAGHTAATVERTRQALAAEFDAPAGTVATWIRRSLSQIRDGIDR